MHGQEQMFCEAYRRCLLQPATARRKALVTHRWFCEQRDRPATGFAERLSEVFLERRRAKRGGTCFGSNHMLEHRHVRRVSVMVDLKGSERRSTGTVARERYVASG